ncbi:MAG: penicillin acylase family protein [Bacteroidota bacterium]
MTRTTRLAAGALGVAAVLAGVLFFFVRHQVTRSFPPEEGTERVRGLGRSAEILRDEYGVPHLRAASEEDVLFALGYVHAQDRLWQMDLARRTGSGRLSEVFGPRTLPFDRMFRTIGLARTAERMERALTDESRRRLLAYAAGVNAVIEARKGRLPVEFDMMDCSPEPWRPEHTLLLARLMAWQLSLSWWSDLTLGMVAGKVGLEKALDVFPSWPAGVPPLVPSSEWRSYASGGEEYLRTAAAFRRWLGLGGALGGSNAWVLGPGKSASGKVILANDVHLPLQAPSLFYEAELASPELSAGGMTFPGIPGVVLGSNRHIAWGLTNLMADDADFYTERVDSADPGRYLDNGLWRPFVMREEEICVRGDTAVRLTVRSTHHGPVVTDMAHPLKRSRIPFVAAMRWTGFEIDDPVEAFRRINRATDWSEFLSGVRLFNCPGQNFLYGDRRGNIGYWAGVKLPLRGRQNATLPLPGWDPSSDWRGFVPFEELPHLFNPPEQYIASANDRVVDEVYPHHISDLWEPPSRILRLREVLGREGLVGVEDCRRLQNDTFSWHAREILPVLRAALEGDSTRGEEWGRMLDYLRNWHCRHEEGDVAAGMFHAILARLAEDIFRDEMGEDLYHDFVLLVNVPLRVMSRLLAEGTSSWFDDVRTPQRETRDEIIRRSAARALADLRGRFGADMKLWRWGQMHTVSFVHPFGERAPLDLVFNTRPRPYGGGPGVLVSGEYALGRPFAVTVGAAARLITDFAREGRSLRILPPGQSGQVFHPHYSDQLHLWLNGAYRQAGPGEGNRAGWKRLRLEPAP